jgi:uncharacterized membrane protein YphA (DoxX/SURF4 family)
MRLALHTVPPRLSTGAYVLHSGLEKWSGSEETANGVHGMAAGAYPFLAKIPPKTFLKALAGSEIALGAALLTPFVSRRLAGLGLTAFAGGLLGMYWLTPALHKPGSPWPTQAGIGISKDVWMAGIGLGLVAEKSAPAGARSAEKS